MYVNNNSFQHNANISRVAEFIWRNAVASRAAISRSLDLYRSTVSNIIGLLEEKGVVLETVAGSSTANGGRKPMTLTLNVAIGCIIGMEIQPETYHVVAIDINNQVLFQRRGLTAKATFPEIFEIILQDAMADVNKLNVPVLAVCVGIPGIIDTHKNKIIMSAPFKLKDFDFESNVAAKHDIPLLVENDARCCAWFDMVKNRQDSVQDFIAVVAEHHAGQSDDAVDEGLGVGIALASGGKIHHGYNFAAGEFHSFSWKSGMRGQTGLPEETTSRIASDVVAFRKWVVDFFSTMMPIVAVYAPEKLYIHGYPAQYKQIVLQTIQDKVPQFAAILKKNGCALEFLSANTFTVAQGAACYYLKKLFSVPDISDYGTLRTPPNWDSLFKAVEKKRQNTSRS